LKNNKLGGLSPPAFFKSFKQLAVDSSDIGVWGMLLQEGTDGIDHPVCYFSRMLSKHQKEYSHTPISLESTASCLNDLKKAGAESTGAVWSMALI
jgi:hypothetical protein